MKRYILVIPCCMLLLGGCNKNSTQNQDNPFFSEWNTPYAVPPFDKIGNEHFMPAFKEGILQIQKEIDAIVENKEKPTFENTVLAFDKAGDLLIRVTSVYRNLSGCNTNEEMQKLALEVEPMLAKHRDNIALNEKLFSRIKAVYDQRFESQLDSSQIRAIEKHYEAFVRSGANLEPAAKEELRKINERIASLVVKFNQNLLAETNKSFRLVIDNEKDLSGLPENVIAGAAEQAEADSMPGKWVFTLQKPSMIPFLQYADNRTLRERIYTGYTMRGNNNNEYDNKELVKEIPELRARKAKLLGFDSYAAYIIDINMAKTPGKVYDFLDQLWVPALKVSKQEVVAMQKIIDAEHGNFKLASWDWWYYAEKLKKQKYDLDESQLKPYLKLDNVRDGMFWVANELYGIRFIKLDSVPVYYPGVEVFKVEEADGSYRGILYLDYFPRDSKMGGAWCDAFIYPVYRNNTRIAPVVTIVCNFTKPTGDVPSLLTWDEVLTLFHEFGHGLHTLFTDGKYDITAGAVPRDYVELPSQIMENWAAEPEVLKQYGKHYLTGEAIPDGLIKKIQESSHFNKGFETVEYVAASYLDLDYHMLADTSKIEDVLAFEKASMDKIGLIDEIVPRYRSTYFGHIFNWDYAAGYYVYNWAAVLDADAFNAFKLSGEIFNKELASKFRNYCLAEIGDHEAMKNYIKFRGQEPSVEPLLRKKGLK